MQEGTTTFVLLVVHLFQFSTGKNLTLVYQGQRTMQAPKISNKSLKFKAIHHGSALLIRTPRQSYKRVSPTVLCCQTNESTDLKQKETTSEVQSDEITQAGNIQNGSVPSSSIEEIPTGELQYKQRTPGQVGATWFRLFFALPQRRFPKESVLVMKLQGEIPDKTVGRFAGSVSVPQICNALEKAAYDPRIVGVCVKVGALSIGWGKLQEIRRYFELFKKSGKFSIAYMERGAEKEYYLASVCEELYLPPSANLLLRGLAVQGTFLRGVLNKIGVEPQVKRIGKYKSAGDQLLRTDMSDAQREQLTALLDDIYSNFVSDVAASRSKSVEEFEELLEKGVFKMQDFKEGGWVTDLLYEDQVKELLEQRTGGKKDQVRKVGIKKYAWVSPSAFGLNGRKCIAVLRTSGAIVGAEMATSGTITPVQVIQKLRQLEKMKNVVAIVLRVDSPGGDALASDLMWREIKRIDQKKPVIASMGDVAASGGYYMSMAARKIVAEALTITGSIGVVTGKFNLEDLYKRIGYKKEVIPRGKYAEILQDYRGFNEDEQELFEKQAEYAYEDFRDKAAASRGMAPEEMQEFAQGRVWSGKQALERGLVDAVGGINRAIAIAKQMVDIKQEDRVTVLEVSREQFGIQQLLAGGVAMAIQSIAQVTGISQSGLFATFVSLMQTALKESSGTLMVLQALTSSNVLFLSDSVEVIGISSLRNDVVLQSNIVDDDDNDDRLF
eukprot:TRINITY_DN19527_c1_g3_i1.p1 TRINITY_DN19527_c1_g3~~TRINITY_DN19527_c1_g3_i1.p1  ORF type:complete len:724 (-),score=114.15 TRINITY_DN19527_c1_g3_i1:175-2346(-)